MAAPRTERLLNLVICLLASRRYVTKEQIRVAVPQYTDCASDEAFERMFERDKDDLREMGIPLETGSNEILFDDEAAATASRRTPTPCPRSRSTPTSSPSWAWPRASGSTPPSRVPRAPPSASSRPPVSTSTPRLSRRSSHGSTRRSRPSDRCGVPCTTAATVDVHLRARQHQPDDPSPAPLGTGLVARSLVRGRATTSTATTPASSGCPASAVRSAPGLHAGHLQRCPTTST